MSLDKPSYIPVSFIESQWFKISKTPITNTQVDIFLLEWWYDKKEYWSEEWWKWKNKNDIIQPSYWWEKLYDSPDHPVTGVSYYEAEAICNFFGGRLPTEAEWNWIMWNGNKKTLYPWWNNFDKSKIQWWMFEKWRCNIDSLESKNDDAVICVLGNVWEWCLWTDVERSILKWWSSWESADSISNQNRYIAKKTQRDNNTWIRVIFDSEPDFDIGVSEAYSEVNQGIFTVIWERASDKPLNRPTLPFRQEWIPNLDIYRDYTLQIWSNLTTLEDLAKFSPKIIHNLFVCVCGWWSEDIVRWYSLKDILLSEYSKEELQGKYIKFTSLPWPGGKISEKAPHITEYTSCVPVEYVLQDDSILSTELNWEKLTPELWAPLRVFIPWLYGYKQVKAIAEIKLVDEFELWMWEEYKWYDPVWIVDKWFELVLVQWKGGDATIEKRKIRIDN